MEDTDRGVEWLYRAIKRSQPSAVKCRKGKLCVSSSLFKDEQGVSVDRKMQRQEATVIKNMADSFTKRLKGIVKLSDQNVAVVKATLISSPTVGNPYHAEIHKSLDEILLDDLQALQLADSCEFVFFDDNKKWIDS